jgi:catechol 2,3-dioxygenase-like lactoylglutathione lyase family enzyme
MLGDAEFQATIAVSDMDRSRRFYEQTLGLEAEREMEAGIVYRCGRGSGFFLYQSGYAGTAQHTVGGWYVEDARATVKELQGRGIVFEEYDFPGLKTVDGVADLGSELAAWFKDPDGNILSVGQFT